MDFHIGVLYYHQRNNCGSFSFTKLEHCGGHKILHTCTAITINCLVFEEIIRNWHRQCQLQTAINTETSGCAFLWQDLVQGVKESPEILNPLLLRQ